MKPGKIAAIIGGISILFLLIVAANAVFRSNPGQSFQPSPTSSLRELESSSPVAITPTLPPLSLEYPPPLDTVPAPTQISFEYPYPAWTFPPPTPANTVTRVPFNKITTRTPVPITPFPTLTLKPGPSPTLIPLKEPAVDAAGRVIFLAQDRDSPISAFYSIGMDAAGKKTGPAQKLSDNDFKQGLEIFPSPNGNYLAMIGEWGVFKLFNTGTGAFEQAAMTSIGSEGIFFDWFPDNQRFLFDAGFISFTRSI